jgi:hypothetical protein
MHTILLYRYGFGGGKAAPEHFFLVQRADLPHAALENISNRANLIVAEMILQENAK